MAEIKVSESKTPIIDFSDLNVKIRKIAGLPPQVKRFANISVYGTKATGDTAAIIGDAVTNKEETASKAKVSEASELNVPVGCTLRLWNTATLTQAEISSMCNWGSTIVVLSGAAEAFKTAMGKAEIQLDPGTIVWYTEVAETTTMESLVKTVDTGVFIDTDKTGKLLQVLIKFLERPGDFPYMNTMEINSKGETKFVVDPAEAATLDSLGYSYVFRTTEKAYPRGFWLGGVQARRVYADLSIKYDVKSAMGNMIAKGMAYNSSTIPILQAKLMNAFKDNPFVIRVEEIRIPPQSPANRVQGLIDKIYVRYEAVNEVRTIEIALESTV